MKDMDWDRLVDLAGLCDGKRDLLAIAKERTQEVSDDNALFASRMRALFEDVSIESISRLDDVGVEEVVRSIVVGKLRTPDGIAKELGDLSGNDVIRWSVTKLLKEKGMYNGPIKIGDLKTAIEVMGLYNLVTELKDLALGVRQWRKDKGGLQ